MHLAVTIEHSLDDELGLAVRVDRRRPRPLFDGSLLRERHTPRRSTRARTRGFASTRGRPRGARSTRRRCYGSTSPGRRATRERTRWRRSGSPPRSAPRRSRVPPAPRRRSTRGRAARTSRPTGGPCSGRPASTGSKPAARSAFCCVAADVAGAAGDEDSRGGDVHRGRAQYCNARDASAMRREPHPRRDRQFRSVGRSSLPWGFVVVVGVVGLDGEALVAGRERGEGVLRRRCRGLRRRRGRGRGPRSTPPGDRRPRRRRWAARSRLPTAGGAGGGAAVVGAPSTRAAADARARSDEDPPSDAPLRPAGPAPPPPRARLSRAAPAPAAELGCPPTRRSFRPSRTPRGPRRAVRHARSRSRMHLGDLAGDAAHAPGRLRARGDEVGDRRVAHRPDPSRGSER